MTTDAPFDGDEAPRRRRLLVGSLVVAVFVAGGTVTDLLVTRHDRTPTRQEVVAQRGAKVMPFDLTATTHQFDTTPTGAIEMVTANRADDAKQIDLIREHLLAESARFEKGDLGDPAAIHGSNMPGLQALTDSAGRIVVTYAEVPAGAKITFTTSDPVLQSGLADWIMAQNMDHGTGMNHG